MLPQIARTSTSVAQIIVLIDLVHTRLVPGLVRDVRLDGDSRVVTFANGKTVREASV
ncbi:MAG TPA: hypothetical protein VE860_10560 [Chthoniobacterales bacterium]|jgi:hypothetical protein|nr:hypothetical protein [Chthoniobacterales bacterium]